MLLVESDLLVQILLDNRVLFPATLCRQVHLCASCFRRNHPLPH